MLNEELIRYDDSVEVKQPDEDELIGKIVASMARVNRRVFDKHRHAVRSAHAKSHGVLKGELSVYDNLPESLQQGIFRSGLTYPVIIRLSSAPGDILHDRVPAAHGMAIKAIGVAGRQIMPGRAKEVTQDFLLVNMPIIPFGDVSSYWKMQQILERHVEDPEIMQRLAAALAREANKVLTLLHRPSPTLYGFSPPNTHVLGDTFYSMAALRYGAYIAKVSATPLSENLARLTGQPTVSNDDSSTLRDFVVDFFRSQTVEYELRVQLCKDLERMPVEDASIEWPEDLSRYQSVAKITLPAQDAYNPARRVYADDRLSFNPWHCIEEHRPLGSIMRVRIKAYETSTRFRHEMNMQPRIELHDINAFPD